MKSIIGAATAAALVSVSLSGCGTITQGTSQNIAIVTSPPGGHCDLNRDGENVATIYSTPDTVHVDRTKDDIMLACTKPGYQPVNMTLESGYSLGTFGNLILGGAVGWGIDSATGADNMYPRTANVQFIPLSGDAAAQIAPSHTVCTPEDQELARVAQENHYSVRLVCN